MKTKVLSFMMAIAVALAFTSCDNKGTSSASDDSDSTSSKSESVSSSSASDEQSEASESVSEETQEEDAAVSGELTGDPAKDAQMAAEEGLEIFSTEIQSKEDLEKLQAKIIEYKAKYENFYKAKGDEELNKFKDEFDKLQNTEIGKKLNDANNKLMQKAMEYMN